MAVATTHNLYIEQGEDYGLQITIKDLSGTPINITNGVIVAQIKQQAGWDALATFSVNKTNPSGGVVVLSLSSNQTRQIPETSAYWDVFLTLNSITYKLAQGSCEIVLAISQ
jgi:hypothetical protein